jgi:hypothetical protein
LRGGTEGCRDLRWAGQTSLCDALTGIWRERLGWAGWLQPFPQVASRTSQPDAGRRRGIQALVAPRASASVNPSWCFVEVMHGRADCWGRSGVIATTVLR